MAVLEEHSRDAGVQADIGTILEMEKILEDTYFEDRVVR